ncbi:hypothetical protein [Microbacterium lushaniae]|uniref:Uncharacterized protein n=1 Tax=Microbacterium lushaniae TaxID=2614639 RepID=A0A5J6L3T3_9MICO|nr:hypothetical protein [Microbacterium lushaniae]QEW03036.1 hypothetical protein F6J85_07925 [Microbacterium lushaniae]
MPTLLAITPGLVGLLIAMVVIRLWPHSVPLVPRIRSVSAGVGLGLALTVEIVVLASGNWPFQSAGHPWPLEWLSGIPGDWQVAAPLLAASIAVAFQAVPVPARPPSTTAVLTRRTPFAFAPKRWLITAGVLITVAAALAVAGGLASQPDEDGAFTMWVQDAGVGSVGRLIYGWAFSLPSVVLLSLLGAATLLALLSVARPSIAEDAAGDQAIRRSWSRTILATTCGAVLIHVGGVLTFFAYTANLRTGVPLDDAIIPVFPPFAALAPLLIVLGVGAIIAGFVIWFRLFLEQMSIAAAVRHSDAGHAH